jgi:hypothetical protein
MNEAQGVRSLMRLLSKGLAHALLRIHDDRRLGGFRHDSGQRVGLIRGGKFPHGSLGQTCSPSRGSNSHYVDQRVHGSVT